MQSCACRAEGDMTRVTRALAALTLGATIASGASAKDDLLDPEQAFRAAALHQPANAANGDRAGILVSFRIVPGHYLYRDRVRLEVLPAGLALGPPEFAAAAEMDDPYFGKSFIYREKATIYLPFAMNVAKGGSFRVRITAQGCAEGRFCYAPFTQEVAVSVPDAVSPRPPNPSKSTKP